MYNVKNYNVKLNQAKIKFSILTSNLESRYLYKYHDAAKSCKSSKKGFDFVPLGATDVLFNY